MDATGIFDSTLSILEKNLDVRTKKHSLTVSNIANMDTPNYKPFDFVVEEAMSKIVSEKENVQITTTNPGHLSQSSNASQSHLSEKFLNIKQNDEPVDIDKVMSNLAQNAIVYNASVQILSKKYALLKDAITGGSR